MRKTILSSSMALALASSALFTPASARPPDRTVESYASLGSAYGSLVSGNSLVSSGRTSPVYMCTAGKRDVKRNAVAEVTDKSPVRVKGVSTWTKRSMKNNMPVATTVSKLASVNVLNGAVRLEGLKARVRIMGTKKGFDRHARTTVGSLYIAGKKFNLAPMDEPRTLAIPGVGSLDLNLQSKFAVPGGGAGYRAFVAKLTLADGTTVRLGKAAASLAPERRGVVSGSAHAIDASALGGLVKVGRVASQPLPCAGTNGEEKTNATAALSVPGVLTVEGAYGRAKSSQGKMMRARTEAGLARVSLASDRIVLHGVNSVAAVRKDGKGKVQHSSKGSHLLGLTVDGKDYAVPADGQSLDIPGLAKLEFGVLKAKTNGFRRVAVRVNLIDGTEVGSSVDVGVASAYIR